ncbi:MAG: ABC transporter permease [Armatimonadetes bacterium]|nr:ABC transporter permease [Armatimonadota bacterium]
MFARLFSQNVLFRMAVHAALWALVLLLAGVLLSIFPFITWQEFTESLRDPQVTYSINFSLLCVGVSTAVSVLLSIPAGYVLSRYRIPLASVVDTIVDLPIVLPQLIAGIALLMFFQTPPGVWIETNIMEFAYSRPGVVLAIFFPTISLAVRSMKAGFDSVDPRYEQVARTLGCTEWQAFRKVALPLARNSLIAGAVLNWAYALGVFGSVVMFSGATRMKTDVIPVAIFLNMTTGRIDLGLTLTIVLLVIAVVSLALFKRLGGKATLA